VHGGLPWRCKAAKEVSSGCCRASPVLWCGNGGGHGLDGVAVVLCARVVGRIG